MGCGSRNEVGRIPRRSYYSRHRQAVAVGRAGGRWLVLEIELWSEPKNQKKRQAQLCNRMIPLPCYHVRPCVRAPDPFSSRNQSRAVLRSVVSLVVCLLVGRSRCPDLYAGTATSEKHHTDWKTVRKLEGRRSQVGTNKITSWTESR
jgi:hypothetical protein